MATYYHPDSNEHTCDCGRLSMAWCEVCGKWVCEQCEDYHARGVCRDAEKFRRLRHRNRKNYGYWEYMEE